MLAVNPLHRNIWGGCCKTHGGERERGSSRSAAHPQSQRHAHVLALPHPMSQRLLSTYRASFSSQSSCPPRHLPHSSPLAKPPLKLCIGREERAIVDSEVGKVLAMNHVKFSNNSHGVDLPALKPKIAIFFVIEPILQRASCSAAIRVTLSNDNAHVLALRHRPVRSSDVGVELFCFCNLDSRRDQCPALVNVSSVLHQSATILSNPQHCLRSLSLAWSSPPSVGLSGATLSKCSDC